MTVAIEIQVQATLKCFYLSPPSSTKISRSHFLKMHVKIAHIYPPKGRFNNLSHIGNEDPFQFVKKTLVNILTNI